MRMSSSAALVALATAAATTSAHAASIDVSPLINEGIQDILVPVVLAVIPTIGAIIVMPLRHYLDQRSGDLLAVRVNDLLDKAIAFAAQQGMAWVADKDFHATVDGALASIASDYAVSHAPGLMKQAGAIASARAGELARQEAATILTQKITARLADHPAVAALKASAPAPLAQAA